MTANMFLGRAKPVAQVTTATPGGTIGTETFTLTVNGKSVSYVAVGGNTVAHVVAGLVAAWQAVSDPSDTADQIAEFAEATATDSSTKVTLTGTAKGTPFTVTGAATGSATLTIAVTTAATGPSQRSDAANWSTGDVPSAGQDVVVEATAVSILHGLDQSAVALSSLMISSSFVSPATVGLPKQNPSGYHEYRDLYWKIDAVNVVVDTTARRINLCTGTNTTLVEVRNTGSPIDSSTPAMLLITGDSINLDIQAGSVGVAIYGGEVATIGVATVMQAGVFMAGPGAILTTVDTSGTTFIACGVTTINVRGGTCRTIGGGAVTNLAISAGGTCLYFSTGTITNLTVNGTLDCSGDASPRTVTNCTIGPGGRIVDSTHSITFTNGITLADNAGTVRAE